MTEDHIAGYIRDYHKSRVYYTLLYKLGDRYYEVSINALDSVTNLPKEVCSIYGDLVYWHK